MYKWIVDLRWNRQSLRIANLNLNPGIVGMDRVWLWMDMREKEKWFSNQKMSIIYMCYCKTLPSYFQESPSYFLYSTTLFEKWNVKYSDTFLVMYVQRILPYVIVHSRYTFFLFTQSFFTNKKICKRMIFYSCYISFEVLQKWKVQKS